MARSFGFALDCEMVERFERFAEMISEANPALNLLSARDCEKIYRVHFLDSISPLLLGAMDNEGSLLDIGSGAGLPGIPLAILAPKLDVTMVESNGKKARFIERAITILRLKNARVENLRAEHLKKEESFDYSTSRAVSKIKTLLPIIRPLLKPKGSAIFFKGPKPEREIAEAEETSTSCGFEKPRIIHIPPNISSKKITLVVFRKAR